MIAKAYGNSGLDGARWRDRTVDIRRVKAADNNNPLILLACLAGHPDLFRPVTAYPVYIGRHT